MVLLVFGKDPSVVSAVVVAVARIDQSGLKLLVAYESSTQYQPRFDFYGIAQRSVRTNIAKESAIASSYCIFHGTSPFLIYKRGR